MPINDYAQYVNVTCLSYVYSTVSSVKDVYTVQPTNYKTNVVVYVGGGGAVNLQDRCRSLLQNLKK
jgi:hypothetical protein